MALKSEASINLSSSQARTVQAAIHQWADQHVISSTLAARLLDTLTIEDSFDWQRFAKYTFRLAIISFAIALASILADKAFLKLIKRILFVPAWLRGIAAAAVAAVVHYWGYERGKLHPLQIWTNESVHALGGLVIAVAAWQFAISVGAFDVFPGPSPYQSGISDEEKMTRQRQRSDFDTEQTKRIGHVLLALSSVYAITGVVTSSNLIWSSAMIVLGAWFGAVTGYLSGMGAYFIGMTYPSRFVLFGLTITLLGYAMRTWDMVAGLWSSTRIWGLLYLFIALWILSIFGNDSFYSEGEEKWATERHSQGKLFGWSLVFAGAAGYCVYHGLRYQDGTMKGFGLTFLGINLYTKFFEFFWSKWYKPLFFAALAGTLAAVGRYAENIWNLELQG